jgi:hypothetical protein
MISRTKLRRRLRHLKPNVVVIFPEFNDRWNYLTNKFHYRRSLADDVPPVSHPGLFLRH